MSNSINEELLRNKLRVIIPVPIHEFEDYLVELIQHTVDKAVIEAKLYETNSTYDTLQEYLLDDWSSDDILTQLQLDLRKYRSDLTDEIKELKGEG